MVTFSTVTGDELASVVLGRHEDLVSDHMAVETYLREYGSRLDARSFVEIESGEGSLELHGEHGDGRIKREDFWYEVVRIAEGVVWRHFELCESVPTCRLSVSLEEQDYERRRTPLGGELL